MAAPRIPQCRPGTRGLEGRAQIPRRRHVRTPPFAPPVADGGRMRQRAAHDARLSVLLPVRDARPGSMHRSPAPAPDVRRLRDRRRGRWLDRRLGRSARGRRAARAPAARRAHARCRPLPRSTPALARHACPCRPLRRGRSFASRAFRETGRVSRHASAGDVVGSRVRLFLSAKGMRRWKALLDHDAMRHEMLIDSPIAMSAA